MALFQIDPKMQIKFGGRPELMMGVQIALDTREDMHIREDRQESRNLYILLNGQVLLILDDELPAAIRTMSSQDWMIANLAQEAAARRFQEWYGRLPFFETIRPLTAEEELLYNQPSILGMIFHGPVGPLPPPPARPPYVHGHLQFHATADANDIFYRYEQFPTSRRILPDDPTDPNDTRLIRVLAGTYAAPFSEAPFVPTGFAAVGRFALPLMTPARWRYELRPVPGASFKCGACVPLYGQAGGGVEVMYVNDTPNDGEIAKPVVLSIL
ncbi:hypothetical protein JQ628_22045 [Bradyrhizobium lablabi]|uniref:hypothetical protein n=1 Tax=Bradyrhizobium lablabi TaxID=722472 RepID=UPI001BABE69E|nr:hypothetical protein [Bradyrhizobium lablabi]MBR1124225.1 hypothetical protein [Bradyrhizobium lablabi]